MMSHLELEFMNGVSPLVPWDFWSSICFFGALPSIPISYTSRLLYPCSALSSLSVKSVWMQFRLIWKESKGNGYLMRLLKTVELLPQSIELNILLPATNFLMNLPKYNLSGKRKIVQLEKLVQKLRKLLDL